MTSEPIAFSAADGYALRGTLWSPDAPPRALVLIHPATAVPERLYAGFARFLTTRGFAALTYNYRGIGSSRPARLTKLQARMRDWIELDVGAAIAWARDTHRAVPLLAVGHSVGGHAVGLSAGTAHLRAAVLVAAHAGSTRLIESAAERLKVRLILHVLGPLASALLGYVPGKRLGLGEDLPAGVFREWSRWTTLPHYFFDDPTLGAAERFSKQRLPILAVGFDDDPWANRRAIDLLVSYLTGAAVERRQIDPHAAGTGPVGHMGFFRSRPGAVLWPGVANWLAQALDARRDADRPSLSIAAGNRT
ncbi:alpha/beta hydrolase family protein [Burkholderia vietnamiensis]|uniref:alpha/beta hydrolase family protein n=1 Tax=Burkholderia vietnamiensis TaxID=60552 RepID=UPI001B9F9782|nr:alpha/beta hydrolase [Burkholderia vietnamiensis]MBR8201796.1 alpha/beta fold hydrolase [Burkholderia vietnamiensis]MCA8226789.1 alpha/beta fold hydrolase [Burkholderia vietnamiensis]MCA8390524.1 alpha/beta fold hydrolase [Burkholderia vietnamiensis]MDN8077492.1 alpha/beta fold hydrolase [Burkholderia vietnamiensis]HDR8956408.1 alpha/beta fold hydrolase [Burkholderia vietnamiensis]